MDGDLSDLVSDPGSDDDEVMNDPACGGGSRTGGCECSCESELGHLNGMHRKLEDLVRLLLADARLAGWE